MKILIKLGGTLIDEPGSRANLAAQIAAVCNEGHQAVVVHGGGRQMTRFLEERGISSRFVNGLRVTTPEILDAVLKVLAGSVNQELVASLIGAGVLAVGLSGIDAGMVRVEQMDPELGAVGRVTSAQPALLELLTNSGYLPVVACVAGDGAGRLFNINADAMAVACAAAFRADRLLFLTDVAGVLDASGTVLPRLSPEAIRGLIDTGVARGGMHAKLDAAVRALQDGVGSIHIISGSEASVIQRAMRGELLGTSISHAPAEVSA